MRNSLERTLFVWLLAIFPMGGMAAEPIPEGMKLFAQQYVSVLRSQSVNDYLKLIHPDCPRTSDLKKAAKKILRSAPLGEYQLEVFPQSQKQMAKSSRYLPVIPTHQLSIKGTRNKNGKQEPAIWGLMLRKKDHRWYNVMCPKRFK